MRVRLQSLDDPIPEDICLALVDKVVGVIVRTTVGPGPTSLSDMLDFARVLSVRPVSSREAASCPCCSEPGARFLFRITPYDSQTPLPWDEVCDRGIIGYQP